MDVNKYYPADDYARLINSAYYGEFDEELSLSILEATRKIDYKAIYSRPDYVADLTSVPFKIITQIERYLNQIRDQVDVDQAERELDRVFSFSAELNSIISDGLRKIDQSRLR